MIIMHPDNVIGTQQLMKLAGKLLVHPEIGGGIAFRQIGEVEAVVTNWPKCSVGEAAIILFDIATRKVAYRIGERSNSPTLGGGATLLAGIARPAMRAVTAEQKQQILRLAKNFPRPWAAATTTPVTRSQSEPDKKAATDVSITMAAGTIFVIWRPTFRLQ
jgi:hypothetical protein